MRAVYPLIRRTLRHQRLQILSVTLLVALAAVPLNLGIITATSYMPHFDHRASQLDTPDGLMTVFDTQRAHALEAELRDEPTVTDIGVDQTLGLNYVTYAFNGADLWTQVTFIPDDRQLSYGRYSIVAEAANTPDNAIYLPLQFRSSGGYELGDPFTVTTTTGEHTFTVTGFIEWVLLGNVNMGQVGFVVPSDTYDTLSSDLPTAAAQTVISIRTGSDADTVMTEALHATAEVGDPVDNAVFSSSITLTRSVTGMGANLLAISLIGFSLVMTLVVVAVLVFIIRNSIRRDLPAIGTLAAIGFASGQIVTNIALAFGIACVIAALGGTGLSYLAMPLLQDTLEQQTGLIWQQGFDPSALLVCAGVLTTAVVATAYATALRIKKISPSWRYEGVPGHTHSSETGSPSIAVTEASTSRWA